MSKMKRKQNTSEAYMQMIQKCSPWTTDMNLWDIALILKCSQNVFDNTPENLEGCGVTIAEMLFSKKRL